MNYAIETLKEKLRDEQIGFTGWQRGCDDYGGVQNLAYSEVYKMTAQRIVDLERALALLTEKQEKE